MSGLYNYRWQKASKAYLALHPLCAECERRGRVTAATVVDHIEPHRGDMVKFWNTANWQSLCEPCHNGIKQRFEHTGIVEGCDINGVPLDPSHPWKKNNGA
jgi:5-methylcytosine-specific restriction endonuclease McrA